MIEMRRAQLSFGDGLIAEEVSDLRENWMKHGHSQNKHLMPFAACAFGAVFAVVDRALQQRAAQHPGGHGRLDAVSQSSYTVATIASSASTTSAREVRANLVYRDFTHVGGGKTPDAKTMGRWGLALGPEVLKQFMLAW